MFLPVVNVDDQRVADAAVHQVPDLALVGAQEDAHAADGGVDDLEVALDVAAAGLRTVPLSGSRTTSVAWPASINCQVLPVSSLRQMPPLVPLMAA